MFYTKLFGFYLFVLIVTVNLVNTSADEDFLEKYTTRTKKGVNIEIRNQLLTTFEDVMASGDFSQVKKFLIINCSLVEIKPRAFKGKIRELTIENNSLNTLSNIFEEQTVINCLELRRNKITLIQGGVFTNVLNLTRLDLSENLLSNINETVLDNRFIKTLIIKKNKLEYITSKMFQNLPKLENLFLDDNKVREIESCSFKFRGILPYLSLKGNLLQNVSNKIISSSKSPITVDLSNNRIKDLSRSALLKIKSLNLSGNQLEYVPAGIFSYTDIKILNLSKNKIEKISKDAFINSAIHDLSLQCNYIVDLVPESFSSLALGRLDLSNNQIKKIFKDAFLQSSILLLHLDNNNLVSITPETFNDVYIEIFILSGNEINFIEANSFEKIIGLKHLGLMRNKLSILKKSVFTNSSLRKIFLDFNNITNIEWGVFDNLQSLQTVTIDLDKLDDKSKNNVLFYDPNYYEYYDAAIRC